MQIVRMRNQFADFLIHFASFGKAFFELFVQSIPIQHLEVAMYQNTYISTGGLYR